MPVPFRLPPCAAAAIAALTLGSPAFAQSRADAAPTFTRDIAPIVFAHCAACHRSGGSAPFSLLTYEDVRARARQIVTAVTAKTMPPWLATTGAGEFAGDRRLSDVQVALFERWLQRGALQGAAADLPAAPVWPDGWSLGSPDLVLRMESPYRLPPGGRDRLRNVVIPIAVPVSRFVRAWELRVTSPAVHHATLVVDTGGAARRLDADDPAPGYEGLIPLSAQSPDGYFLGWTPGQTPYDAGSDMAWRVDPGNDLVAMLHLRPTGAWESVDISVALYFSDRPPSTVPVMMRMNRQDIAIPPGVSDYRAIDRYTLPVDVALLGIQPHAHYLAKEIRGTALLPDGTTTSLLHIRRWDFHWQDVYRFQRPVRLPAGTQVTMEISFDNSAGNRANPSRPPRRVTFGQSSDDEMADLWMQVVPTVSADRDRLVADLRRKLLPQNMDGYRSTIGADPDNASLHDELALLGIEAGDYPLAIAEFEQSLRLRPDVASSHYNVGNALLVAGRPGDATPHFREAVRRDSTYALAHQGLGLALAATGRIDEAATALERAVALVPESADARYNLGVVHQAQGAFAAAERELRAARALRPGWAAASVELAWTLAVSPDASVRNPGEALTLARESAQASGGNARAAEALAAALAASGLYDEAAVSARRALSLLPPDAPASQRAAMEERVVLYSSRRPFFASSGQPR